MPRWRATSPRGRCPSCGYDRAGINHWVLCIRTHRPAWTPERARLVALTVYGDTAAEQWWRRFLLWEETK